MARWSSQTTHTDISDFSDNPNLRKELKVWRLKIGAAILVVLAVVGFSAKPAYRAYREHRINKNLEAAGVAVRLEDWGAARDKARSVLMARPGNFEAYRIWSRALGKMGEPRAYMAATQVFVDPRGTDEDRLECVSVLAIQAPQAVALSAYASLSEDLRNDARFRAAIAPLLVKRGEIEIVEKGLREVTGPKRNPVVLLELLRVLCARPSKERVDEARVIFAELIECEAQDQALSALILLGDTPGGLAHGDPLTETDLSGWVRKQPKATTLHHLLALHPAIDRANGGDEVHFREAINRFLEVDPGKLGTWLIMHGRAKEVPDLLKQAAETSSEAYLARLHALLRLGRDTEIEAALAEPPASADMLEIEIVNAAMARRRGDLAAANAAWTRALNQAGFDTKRNRFIGIAKTAETYGAIEAASDAWVGAVRSGWGPLPLYVDLTPVIGYLAKRGRSEDLLAIFRTLIRFEPRQADLVNNFQYLALIHGVLPPKQVTAALESLAESHPNMSEVYSALILAKLMAGEPADAQSFLPRLENCQRVSPMMKLALQGAVLVLNGDAEAGTSQLSQVSWRLFMRQERIIFRDILTKSDIAGLPLPELERENPEINPDLVPAWRKAVERMEKERAGDVLPALPAPSIPSGTAPAD